MGTSPDFVPYRACCGQQHLGVQCPDGKVMCCICFKRFDVADLSVDPTDGKTWDVCKGCDAEDRGIKPADTGDVRVCGVCGGRIEYYDSPSGSWWAHSEHPADGHDALPQEGS
jgi:hypothetical protein